VPDEPRRPGRPLAQHRIAEGADLPGEIRIERFGWTFCPGDKVMQIENDYDKEVYNGDLGVVSRIDVEAGELAVDFEGREVTYGVGELANWCWPMRQRSTRARARNTLSL